MTLLLRPAGCVLLAVASLPSQGGVDPLDRALDRVQQRLMRRDVWQDHSTWDNAWLAQTEHFAVRTTRSYGFGRRLAEDLEAMLGHFQSTLGVQTVPAQRVEVHVFPDVASYNQFGNQFGQEHSSWFSAFLAVEHPELVIGAVDGDNLTQLRMDLTHAALHRWLRDAFPGTKAPTWLQEGLASYFALFWAFDWGLEQFESMRTEKRLLPLVRLLGDPLAAYQDRPRQRAIQLGVLFSYLLAYRDDTRTSRPDEGEPRGPFRDYLVSALRGSPVTGSPVHKLVRRLGDLEDELENYAFQR